MNEIRRFLNFFSFYRSHTPIDHTERTITNTNVCDEIKIHAQCETVEKQSITCTLLRTEPPLLRAVAENIPIASNKIDYNVFGNVIF